MDLKDLTRACSFLDGGEGWSPTSWHRTDAQVVCAPTVAPDLDTLFAQLLGEQPAQAPQPAPAPVAPWGLDAPGEPTVFTELSDLDDGGAVEQLEVQLPTSVPAARQDDDIWSELALEG